MMNKKTEYNTDSPEQTEEVAKNIARELEMGTVLCLWGELGAGKTTFTRGFVRGLGIENRVMSPTFTIIRTYTSNKSESRCYHIDLYRLEAVKSLSEIGLDELISDPNSYTIIEWPERLGHALPSRRVDVHINVVRETGRKITVRHYD